MSIFNKVVPWVLLLLPGIAVAIFGPTFPALFAPALLESSGDLVGVFFATFVLSAAVAVIVTCIVLEMNYLWLAAITVFALLAANGIALLLGFQSLAPRTEFVIYGQPILTAISTFVAYFVAGTETYGWGGALLAVVAGALAGYRFGKWLEKRVPD